MMINYKNTEKIQNNKKKIRKHEYLKTQGATKLSKWQYEGKKKTTETSLCNNRKIILQNRTFFRVMDEYDKAR